MTDGEIDISDETLAQLSHAGLVALLNRLYARVKESPITDSTARASTEDELRSRIRAVCERIAARSRAPSNVPAAGKRGRPAVDRSAEARPERPFVVLVTQDPALVKRARTVCQTRGVVLVSVSSGTAFATLAANVTPTHLVIDDGASKNTDADAGWLRELTARGVRVHRVEGQAPALDALSEIE